MINQAFLLTLASETEDQYTRSISPHIKLTNITKIQIWRNMREQGEQITLRDVTLGISKFKATDLRYNIFAVLVFSGNLRGGLAALYYTMKLSKVYFETAVRSVGDESVCRILFAAGIGHFCDIIPGLEGLPSWVPDWSRASHIALSFINPTIDYHAGGDAQVDMHRLEDASLFLSTHLFDTIAELAPILDGGVSSVNRIKGLKQS
jgi:hypothetical protein